MADEPVPDRIWALAPGRFAGELPEDLRRRALARYRDVHAIA